MDNGEWVYGWYVFREAEAGFKEQKHYILTHDECGFLWHEVVRETVGMFTGELDKVGTMIYDGDVVHVHDTLLQCTMQYYEFDGYVDYSTNSFTIVSEYATHYRWADYECEVLGNIHDNQELLGNSQNFS